MSRENVEIAWRAWDVFLEGVEDGNFAAAFRGRLVRALRHSCSHAGSIGREDLCRPSWICRVGALEAVGLSEQDAQAESS
jgi:hypothetical protein